MRPKKKVLVVCTRELLGLRYSYPIGVRGYQVFTADSTEEFVRRLAGVDAVLLFEADTLLPVEQMARLADAAAVPVMVLKSGDGRRKEVDYVASAVLPAHISMAELLDRLKVLLIRKTGPKGSAHLRCELAKERLAKERSAENRPAEKQMQVVAVA